MRLRGDAMRKPVRIEQTLREALTGAGRVDVQRAVGWDDSNVSRFLSGSQGVVIEKLDALVASVGYVLITRKYLDAVATLGEVGMHCECARQGLGECGGSR